MNGAITLAGTASLEREADPAWLKWAILLSASLGALLEKAGPWFDRKPSV